MDQSQSTGPLTILLGGFSQQEQDRFGHVLKTNLEHWGYRVVSLPPMVSLLENREAYECDIWLFDLDESYRLASLINGRDSSLSTDLPPLASGLSEHWSYSQKPQPLTILLSSKSILRTVQDKLGAVAFLQKPLEMGHLQRYLGVMQRLLGRKQVAVSPRSHNSTPKTTRILIVEDNPNIADAIRECLKTETGYEIAVARDGLDALEQCLDWSPDCLVTDLLLPWMNGYQVIHCLSASASVGSLPTLPTFVVLSALPQVEMPVKFPYLQGKVIEFLNKPFCLDQLLNAIERACQ